MDLLDGALSLSLFVCHSHAMQSANDNETIPCPKCGQPAITFALKDAHGAIARAIECKAAKHCHVLVPVPNQLTEAQWLVLLRARAEAQRGS